MLVAQQQRAVPPLLLPTSKRQRAGADRNAGGSVKRGQLGVVVAPLMRMARLHMAPPRPLCRGLDEKASGAGVLAALWRTSQGVQKPQPACWGKRFLTGSQEQVVAPSAGPGSGQTRGTAGPPRLHQDGWQCLHCGK